MLFYMGQLYIQDTSKWCEVVQIPIPDPPFITDSLVCVVDSTTGDTLGRLFSFQLILLGI